MRDSFIACMLVHERIIPNIRRVNHRECQEYERMLYSLFNPYIHVLKIMKVQLRLISLAHTNNLRLRLIFLQIVCQSMYVS